MTNLSQSCIRDQIRCKRSAKEDALTTGREIRATRSLVRELAPGERTITGLLDRGAALFGDRVLLRFGQVELSYEDVRAAAAARAEALRAAGVGPGDRVALICSNRPELVELILGCVWAGVVAVPVNTAIRDRQLGHVLADSGPRILVAEGEGLGALAGLDPPPQDIEEIWALDPEGGGDGARAVGDRPSWAEVKEVPPGAGEGEAAPARPGDTAAILYTSGTTGPPKGVCCPHAQICWYGALTGELLEVGAEDVLYTTLPMFHVNALSAVFQALGTGATLAVDPRFSASRYWERCAETGATVTYLLGAMVSILDRREPGPNDTAHRVRVALAPATPAPLHERFRRRFGVALVEGYASTETNVALGAPAGETRPGSMGYTREGFEARVVDAEDADVPDGTPGELVLRHREPFAFATGYWGLPEATIEAWRNLWFHTGDRVVREADGWFRFVDRAKDAIRRRGENISSFEVEQAILTHEAVAAAAAFPVPSELGEDEVMVAVLPRPGMTLEPGALVEHLEPRLARFAIPRYVEVADELPLTENGKVRKAELRERGVTRATWDREAGR